MKISKKTNEELISEYKIQIRRLEERIKQLTEELYCLDGGERNELFIRIHLLNEERENMWDSVNMMKKRW